MPVELAAVAIPASHRPTPDDVLELAGIQYAPTLLREEFPPLKYLIPGCIPEGYTILAGSPKVGKSFLALGLACALATGGNALGTVPVGAPRPVLYFALEDGERRVQDRLSALRESLAVAQPSELHRLAFIYRSGDFYKSVEAWFEKYDGLAPVVILDTLAAVMPANLRPGDYRAEYGFGSGLHKLMPPGGSLLGVHHTRKAEAADFLDSVSGTNGVAGSADAVAVLRRPRGKDQGAISVTSRDAAEGAYAVTRLASGVWHLDGGSLGDASAKARRPDFESDLSSGLRDVLRFVNGQSGDVRAADVAEYLGRSPHTVGTQLGQLAELGRLARTNRGVYHRVEGVEDVEDD